MQLHLIHDALAGGLELVRERACGFVGQQYDAPPRVLRLRNRSAGGAPLRIVGANTHRIVRER